MKQLASRVRQVAALPLVLVVGALLYGALAIRHRQGAPAAAPPAPSTAPDCSPEAEVGGGSDEPELTLGRRLERELEGGAAHRYRVCLLAGWYLEAVAVQRGVDVALTLSSVSAEDFLRVDGPNGSVGEESLAVVAARSGPHRLEIRAIESSAAPGSYEVYVRALRPAGARDRRRAAAARTLAEAERLSVEGGPAARRDALARFEAALVGLRELKEPAAEARALRGLGRSWAALGEVWKANRAYADALAIYRRLRDPFEEVGVLNDIGPTFRLLGEPAKAAAASQRALEVAQATGDRLGEVTALNNLGVLHDTLGEVQQALGYYERSLAGWRELGDRRREAVTLHNLGASYSQLGRVEDALDVLAQALALRRQVGDRNGEAATLSAVGWAQDLGGEPEAALAAYDESLRLRREVGDRRGEAATLDRRSLVYARMGRREEALAAAQEALRLFRRVGDRSSQAHSMATLGWLYEAGGEPERARDHFADSLALFRLVGEVNGEAFSLLGCARAERQLGDLALAQTRIEEALQIVESTRGRVQSRALRSSYLAARQDYYELYIELLMQRHEREPRRGFAARALEASERARARELLDSLVEASADPLSEAEPARLARLRELEQAIRAQERRRADLEATMASSEGAAAERELRSLLVEYESVWTEIRARSPRLAALSRPRPLGASDIQRLLDEDTLLLWYALGAERSFLWVISPSSLASYPLAGRSTIELAARRVHELLTQSHQRGVAEQAALGAAALSELLLGPVAGELGRKRLLVVGDGALHSVPFAALPVPRGPRRTGSTRGSEAERPRRTPLVVDHEIVSVPSASVLALVRQELAGRRPAPKALAVVADPVFDRDDPRVGRRPRHGSRGEHDRGIPARPAGPVASVVVRSAREVGLERLERLVHAGREAEAILSLAGEGETLSALGFQANRSTVLDGDLGSYRILHFATHGLLNARHPELSGIVLSLVDEQGEPQDGFVRLYDIYRLRIQADLVVLSACRTALGTDVRGEGPMGLPRGFLVAGAPRVVVSLWDVNDEATALLMTHFYRGMLRDGLGPVEALRAAQLAMLAEARWAAPYYWAGFVVQGEWR